MSFGELVGLSIEEMDDGTAVVRLDAEERHLNRGGSVHGGAIATLVDTAMGTAVVSAHGDKEGAGTATIEMTVTYLEPAQPGALEARAKVRKQGKRITIVETEVIQEGEMVAHAIATFTSPTS